MKISLLDASNYFKGLLLLIKRDNNLSESEVTLMKRIGKSLGFEQTFCETAINDILENKYIVDTPPVFSLKELAMKFIKDGLLLASSKKEIHDAEKEWLRTIAEKNGVDTGWFQQMINVVTLTRTTNPVFEAEGLRWE